MWIIAPLMCMSNCHYWSPIVEAYCSQTIRIHFNLPTCLFYHHRFLTIQASLTMWAGSLHQIFSSTAKPTEHIAKSISPLPMFCPMPFNLHVWQLWSLVPLVGVAQTYGGSWIDPARKRGAAAKQNITTLTQACCRAVLAAPLRRLTVIIWAHTEILFLHAREDVHNRLMRRYEDAPIAWYLQTFITMFVTSKCVVSYYPIYLP